GEMNLQFANDPHPDNPHTSALAAWSAINLLKSQLEKFLETLCPRLIIIVRFAILKSSMALFLSILTPIILMFVLAP
ncbi:MAG: DUF108 domain-containing protein, partial [Chloroflexi bacterium]|nr:DUF108 domain-containing protein [Chloroflexota bacterium]